MRWCKKIKVPQKDELGECKRYDRVQKFIEKFGENIIRGRKWTFICTLISHLVPFYLTEHRIGEYKWDQIIQSVAHQYTLYWTRKGHGGRYTTV